MVRECADQKQRRILRQIFHEVQVFSCLYLETLIIVAMLAESANSSTTLAIIIEVEEYIAANLNSVIDCSKTIVAVGQELHHACRCFGSVVNGGRHCSLNSLKTFLIEVRRFQIPADFLEYDKTGDLFNRVIAIQIFEELKCAVIAYAQALPDNAVEDMIKLIVVEHD